MASMDRNSSRISTMLDPASLTALAAMNHLVPIANDEQQAWENIEMIADAIDVVVALVENNQMTDETGKAATVDYLLKMLSSPCEEVVKLSLSGLDRIVFKNEVAVYAVRIGAFDYLANLITRTPEGQYEKIKSSDVLAFLMAPPENKYLKTSALNHKVFDEHLRMVLNGTEKERERGLQFLWCITHNCKEAQERVITKPELFPVILQAIADADCGRNALRLLHNLSKSDSAKKRLPVKEISNLVKPIMNIPDHIISKKDKAITALTVANLLEGGQPVDPIVVGYLRDMVYELVQASFYSSKFTLMEVIACFNNLAGKEENKMILVDCRLIKTIIDIVRLKDAPEKVIGKGYTLANVKEMAAKTLWYLAYNEAIQQKMRQDGGGLADLKDIFPEIQEEKLKKNIKDILWIFELKDANQKMTNLKSTAGNISKTNLLSTSSPTISTKSPTLSPAPPTRAVSPSPSPSTSISPSPSSASPSSASPSPSPAPAKTYNFSSKSAATSSPTTSSSTPSYKPPSASPSSSTPSYKPPTPSSSSSPSSTPSYKPPTPSSSSSSTPSYKPPTPSSKPISSPPSTSSSSNSSVPTLKLEVPAPSASSPSPSHSPSPSPVPNTSPPATPSPRGETNGTQASAAPTPTTSAPKYGKAAATSSPTTTTTPGERPKWMVGGARAGASPTPSATTNTTSTPPLSSSASAASLSAAGNKPKWFVSKK